MRFVQRKVKRCECVKSFAEHCVSEWRVNSCEEVQEKSWHGDIHCCLEELHWWLCCARRLRHGSFRLGLRAWVTLCCFWRYADGRNPPARFFGGSGAGRGRGG